jgi:hypothetical protein
MSSCWVAGGVKESAAERYHHCYLDCGTSMRKSMMAKNPRMLERSYQPNLIQLIRRDCFDLNSFTTFGRAGGGLSYADHKWLQ